MRTDQQISPASSSSSSSGLLADIDMGSRRPRRESELEVAVQKLKEMSTTTTKGDRLMAELHLNGYKPECFFLKPGNAPSNLVPFCEDDCHFNHSFWIMIYFCYYAYFLRISRYSGFL